MPKKGSFEVKVGLAEMLKGGVIMDVMNAKQAKQAEQAGAVSIHIGGFAPLVRIGRPVV